MSASASWLLAHGWAVYHVGGGQLSGRAYVWWVLAHLLAIAVFGTCCWMTIRFGRGSASGV